MDRDIYVVVAVPSNGTWRDETAGSVALMLSYCSVMKPLPGVRSLRTGIETVQSSMLPQSRHILVKKACQKQHATHLMFVDADMEFPQNAMRRMLEADKDIIAANCTTRTFPVQPVAFDFDGKRINSANKSGLERVRQVGMAVSLIRLDVFRKLRPPFFPLEWIPESQAHAGEDVYFCQLAQAAGLDVWIDHDLSREILHVGSYKYGYKDVKDGDLDD